MFYITVKDRYMHKLGIISNDIPGAIHFKDDKQHEFLAEGAELFDLTIEKYANGILQENIGILSYGNILSFYDEYNIAHEYMIQHPVETRRTIQLQCSSLNLELIHEEVGKYSASKKMSFFQYLNEMSILINSSMQLNVNEVSDKLLTLTFDSQQTKLARLLSIVNSFDAECEMIPILTTQGFMDHIELNVYRANDGKTNSGVGRFRNDVLLTIGKDIQDITRDVDGTNLFNAVTVTGQNGETFTDISTSILNDNGVEEYYIRSGSSTAFAPISRMKYPATGNADNTDGYTRRDFQTQYTSQADLAGYAIRMLKSYAYPVITYKLSMTTGLNWDRYKLRIGDTIKISDMKFDDQGLILSARVTEKVTSRANPNLNSVTLSNFVRRQVQTSNDLQNLIKQQIPYNISILTDNGTVLKKAGDSTTLSVYMSKGQDLDTQIIPDRFIWSINGNAVPAGGTLLLRYDDLKKDTNIITVQTIINNVIVGSAQITITKVTDGKDGRSIIGTPKYKYMVTQSQVVPSDEWGSTKWSDIIPTMSSTNKYLWQISQTLYTAEPFSSYATILNSVYGDNGNDGIAGKDGVGLKKTDITYAISTDGTISPTSGWTAQVPTLVKGQYLWTKTIWTYTDNSSKTGYSVTYISIDGNNGKDGIAGKDGVGIKTTTITYAGSTSGTTAPTSGWTTTVPTVAAGSYLWTKTVWTYTDNTSETGYSVAKMGNTGPTGPAGAPGTNGAPGKVVSDTEPISLFKGLTWKYSGTAKLTASDGTVINPNTEYYYNGTHWVINYLSANNLEANSITADLIDAKNLTITDGEFVSTIIDGSVKTQTEIKDDHLLIYKMNTSHNEIHTIALKSDSGLGMTYQNSDTREYTSAGVNFQGLFMQNNITNEFARLTPQGTKLSTDVPWTTLAATGGFSGGTIQFSIQNGVAYFSVSGVSVPSMTGGTWYQCAQLPTGSRATPSVNRVTTAFCNSSVWGFLVSTSGGIFFQSRANISPTANLANALAAFPIG